MELPRDLGLELRMVVAVLVATALLTAGVGACLWIVVSVPEGWRFLGILLALVVAGLVTTRWQSRGPAGGRRAAPADELRVATALDRLALNAGVPSPRVVVEAQDAPLSWTTALPRRRPAVHVTTGLLDRLPDRELQAVLAHELAHVAHRDAVLVTMLAGPPAYLLAGLRTVAESKDGRGKVAGAVFAILLVPPAAVMLATARLVSRYRELAADRAAALLTGSAESVAAALLALDTHLAGMPTRDLRAVAARDDFHFVPVRATRWWSRPWATHPTTARRIERLEALAAAAVGVSPA